MRKFNRDVGASLFFLGTGMAIILVSLQYDLGTLDAPGPGLISFCCGSLTCLLSLMGIYSSRGRRLKEERFFGPHWSESSLIFLLLLGFALFFDFLGFLVCTFLFMFIVLARAKTYGWMSVWAWSSGTAAALYVIFQLWLQTQFPPGLLRYIGV